MIAVEAARMRAPKITERAVRTQTEVIREEILGKLRKPYGGFPGRTCRPCCSATSPTPTTATATTPPSRHVTADDCADFFARHYGPGNAVLTVTGDVSTGHVLDVVTREFGPLPAAPAPERVSRWSRSRWVPGRASTSTRWPLPAFAVGHRVPDPAAGSGRTSRSRPWPPC